MKYIYTSLIFLVTLLTVSCEKSDSHKFQANRGFRLESVIIGDKEESSGLENVSLDANIRLLFSQKVSRATVDKGILLKDSKGRAITLDFMYDDDVKTVVVMPQRELLPFEKYTLIVQPLLKSADHDLIFTGKVVEFTTGESTKDQFPRIDDDELLTLIQKSTFKYFWNDAHPTSGMAKERLSTPNIVTTGGTGFGVMSMIVAIERGFISREEAALKVNTIVDFLDKKCEKYHGAYAHWIDGETGKTIAFSTYDDGADLVETALLFQGLLTARQYFNLNNEVEQRICAIITKLWEAIEWDFFTNNSDVLYWHWSPKFKWKMALEISGWNESLIVYALAASSPSHPISADVYHKGWARSGNMKNGNSYYGITLPLGTNYGGPLFLSHYSFLGLNPNVLEDQYANYFEQNKAHSLINREHAIINPNNYKGYSKLCWGFTAGDGDKGYSAFSPTNDKGVITLTGAISSIIYTPMESMDAIRYFYYKMGDKLWTDKGFIDGFNLSSNWFAKDYIAINQGPIIVSIENHRSGLLWGLLMSAPEIKSGLNKLGFKAY